MSWREFKAWCVLYKLHLKITWLRVKHAWKLPPKAPFPAELIRLQESIIAASDARDRMLKLERAITRGRAFE